MVVRVMKIAFANTHCIECDGWNDNIETGKVCLECVNKVEQQCRDELRWNIEFADDDEDDFDDGDPNICWVCDGVNEDCSYLSCRKCADEAFDAIDCDEYRARQAERL